MGAGAHMRPKTAALNTHPELRIADLLGSSQSSICNHDGSVRRANKMLDIKRLVLRVY